MTQIVLFLEQPAAKDPALTGGKGAAPVPREYRIPAVIMTKDASSEIKNGQTITVDGDQGSSSGNPSHRQFRTGRVRSAR